MYEIARKTPPVAPAPVALPKKHPRSVLVPVRCPACGKSTSMRAAWIVLDMALNRWNRMKLQAPCCRVSWNGSAVELDDIRRHVGVRARGRD